MQPYDVACRVHRTAAARAVLFICAVQASQCSFTISSCNVACLAAVLITFWCCCLTYLLPCLQCRMACTFWYLRSVTYTHQQLTKLDVCCAGNGCHLCITSRHCISYSVKYLQDRGPWQNNGSPSSFHWGLPDWVGLLVPCIVPSYLLDVHSTLASPSVQVLPWQLCFCRVPTAAPQNAMKLSPASWASRVSATHCSKYTFRGIKISSLKKAGKKENLLNSKNKNKSLPRLVGRK